MSQSEISLSLIIHLISSRTRGESPLHTRSTPIHVYPTPLCLSRVSACLFVGACALCASPPCLHSSLWLSRRGGSGEAQNVTLSDKKKSEQSAKSLEKLGSRRRKKKSWKPLQNVKVLTERWKSSQIFAQNEHSGFVPHMHKVIFARTFIHLQPNTLTTICLTLTLT